MNSSMLNRFLITFDNLSQFLKIVQIIKNKYSVTMKNYAEVTYAVNDFLNLNLIPAEIQEIIHQIDRFPDLYGFSFIRNYENFSQEAHLFLTTRNETTLTLTPEINACIICKTNVPLIFKSNRLAKPAMLFTIGRIEKCNINTKYCTECHNYYFISYAINNNEKLKIYYPTAHNNRYFHCTQETVFEQALLRHLLADIVYNHTSFRGFTQSYNYRYAIKELDRQKLELHRISDAFFAYHLQQFFSEFRLGELLQMPLPNSNRESESSTIDFVINSIKGTFFKIFVSKWSKHTHIKIDTECNKTLTYDGNWKLSRAKCCYDNKWIRIPDFGEIRIGCSLTPCRLSYYCNDHANNCLTFQVDETTIGIKPQEILVTKKTAQMVIEKIYDSYVDYDEKELFLCKIKDASFGWFIFKDIPKTLMKAFVKRKTINDEFKRKQQKIDVKECNVDKTDSYICDLKCRTRGLLLACSNCGVIIAYRELFGAESLTQVAMLFVDIYDNYNGEFPKFCVYDNACKLEKFCKKTLQNTIRSEIINKTKFVVDRLHIKGHIGKDCKLNNNPNNFPELNGINTMVCEQINFWAIGYKHTVKHMNNNRYIFFLFIIFNEFNKIRCNGKANVFELFKTTRQTKKRKLENIFEEEEEI